MRSALSVILTIVAVSSFGYPYQSHITNNLWSADSGSWSGDYLTETRWGLGHIPGALEWAHIEPSADAAITMPSGTYETFGSLYVSAVNDVSVTIAGTNSVFRMPRTERDIYPTGSFGLAYWGTRFLSTTVNGSTGTNYQPVELTDYSFRVTADGNRPTAHLDRGTYDFDSGDSASYGIVLFDVLYENKTHPERNQGDTTVWFHPGTTLRTRNLSFLSVAPQSTLRLDGATATVSGSAMFPPAGADYHDELVTTGVVEVVNGGSLALSGATFGNSTASFGVTTNKSYRVRVAGDGSTLTSTGSVKFQGAGDFQMDVADGGLVDLQNAAYFPDSSAAKDIPIVSRISVSNATLRVGDRLYLGLRTGPYPAATSVLNVDGGTLANLGAFELWNNAELSLANTSVWGVTNSVLLCAAQDAENAAARVTVTDSDVLIGAGGKLNVGSSLDETASDPVLVISNSTVALDGELNDCGGRIELRNVTVTGAGKLQVGQGNVKHAGVLYATNSVIDSLGSVKYQAGTIVAEDCTWTDVSSTGFGTSSVFDWTLRGGSFTQKMKVQCSIGGGARAVSALRLERGAVFDLGTTYGFNLANGTAATGTIHIVDGTFQAKNVQMNLDANCQATLKLDGGVLQYKELIGCKAAGAGASARLFANGGCIRALGKPVSGAAISGFTETAIGPKGLTIDSNGNAITITQAFADVPGESGELILTGKGVKTLNGAGSTVSTIVVAGGTVVFADDFAYAGRVVVSNDATVVLGGSLKTLTGLVLGDATTKGIVQLAPTEMIAVAGPVAFPNAKISFASSPAMDTAYTLVTSTSALTPDVQRDWMRSDADGVTLSAGYGLGFEAADAADGSVYTLICRQAEVYGIEVADGVSSNVSKLVAHALVDIVQANVGANASLNLAGGLVSGSLEKSGAGRLDLTGAGSYLKSGFLLDGGILSLYSLDLFGDASNTAKGTLRDGTLEFAAAGTGAVGLDINTDAERKNAVIIKADADVEIPVAKGSCGALIKRGAGRVTMDVSKNTTWATTSSGLSPKIPSGQKVTGNNWTCGTFPAFDESGAVPDGAYGAFNIAEGEFCFRGVGETMPTLTLGAEIMLGLGTPTGSVAPAFVLDHVTVDQVTSSAYLGCGFTSDGSFADVARLVITNKAVYLPNHLAVGMGSTKPGFHVETLVDDATLSFRYDMGLNSQSDASHTNTYLIRNNGRFFGGWIPAQVVRHAYTYGPAKVRLESGSLFAIDENRTPLERLLNYQAGGCPGRFIFELKDSTMAVTNVTVDSGTDPVEHPFTFDNSEWWFGTASKVDIAFSRSNVGIYATGGGFILAPPAASEWRLATAVKGDGGLVKRGEGTLVLDTAELCGEKDENAAVLRCSGTNRVESGVLAIAPNAAPGILLAGTGTVSGTIERATLVPAFGDAAETLCFKDATFVGRIGVVLPEVTEDDLGRSFTVARYDGEAPQARFKGANLPKGLRAVFTSENGTVTATIDRSAGMLLLVR